MRTRKYSIFVPRKKNAAAYCAETMFSFSNSREPDMAQQQRAAAKTDLCQSVWVCGLELSLMLRIKKP